MLLSNFKPSFLIPFCPSAYDANENDYGDEHHPTNSDESNGFCREVIVRAILPSRIPIREQSQNVTHSL